jgi:RimJ/RimL family protein N-acetyltransferase
MASASLSDGEFPSLFRKMLEDESSPGARTSNVVMHDLELNHPVGMTQLVNNTTDLSVQVKNLWLTPTRRGQQLAHESLLLLLNWLFSLGYRRIEAPVDAANAIGRKFFERCGFALEAVLRKHRVVANRNRDTALYRLLNSDWAYASMKLYKYLGVTPVAPRFPQDEEDEDEDSEVGSDGSPRVVQGSVAYVGEGEPDAEQKKIQ